MVVQRGWPTRLCMGMAWGMCWLAVAAPAVGQLRVLSQEDPAEQWRRAQLASLSGQLQTPELVQPLRQELEAQQQWLTAWTPGKMPAKAAAEGDDAVELWQEPAVDPSGLAGELRQRLLGVGARPTSRDTKELEQLLAAHPEDLGVRQLHLHWLDQPQYRKTYPADIARAAAKVLSLLDAGQPAGDEGARARLFALYRRGRALVYRELPEVVAAEPLTDQQRAENQSELLGVYHQLKELSSEDRPEFVLLDIRMLRNDSAYGRALQLLEKHAPHVDRQWYLKKRRDMLRELGWELPAAEAAEIYAAAFPEQVAAELPPAGTP